MSMSTAGWVGLAIVAIVPFLPLFFRAAIARIVMDRMVRAADGLWREAGRRGLTADPQIVGWHDGIIMLAAIAPHVAGGLLDLKLAVPRRRRLVNADEASNPVEGAEWALPYLVSALGSLAFLEFFGFPYYVDRWFREFIGSLAMACQDEQGASKHAPVKAEAARAAHKFDIARHRVEAFSNRMHAV